MTLEELGIKFLADELGTFSGEYSLPLIISRRENGTLISRGVDLGEFKFSLLPSVLLLLNREIVGKEDMECRSTNHISYKIISRAPPIIIESFNGESLSCSFPDVAAVCLYTHSVPDFFNGVSFLYRLREKRFREIVPPKLEDSIDGIIREGVSVNMGNDIGAKGFYSLRRDGFHRIRIENSNFSSENEPLVTLVHELVHASFQRAGEDQLDPLNSKRRSVRYFWRDVFIEGNSQEVIYRPQDLNVFLEYFVNCEVYRIFREQPELLDYIKEKFPLRPSHSFFVKENSIISS